MSNELCILAKKYNVDKCPDIDSRWPTHSYTPAYHTLLKDIRLRPFIFLEIGIGNVELMNGIVNNYKPGASLRMWRDYMPAAQIFGCDIITSVLFEEDRIKTFYADQSDQGSLYNLYRQIYKESADSYIDIIIDDGGHTMNQQVVTYEEMFPFLNDNGVYLCEDVHTSYWPGEYGGSYKGNTFIEYSKNFIDYLHASYSSAIPKTYSGDNIHGIHYYDSMIVIEKRKKPQIFHTVTGKI